MQEAHTAKHQLYYSEVEAESFQSWYSWFLPFLPQWFMIPTRIFFQIHYSRRLLIIYWLNDFLTGNLVSFCMVYSAFKLLLHADSVSSFVWSRYRVFLIYTCILLGFSQSRYSWFPSRSAKIHDSQVFKTKIPDSYMFFKASMIHDSWFRFHPRVLLNVSYCNNSS